jgi:hypothetical protein
LAAGIGNLLYKSRTAGRLIPETLLRRRRGCSARLATLFVLVFDGRIKPPHRLRYGALVGVTLLAASSRC